MTTRRESSAPSADFEFDALREAANYRRALAEEFGPWLKGRVLEIGAGIGQFTATLREQPGIGELLSVEPDPGFCQEWRRQFPTGQLLQDTAAAVPLEPGWDALVSVNVLEHIEADAGELRRYAALLRRREGHLCLFVPARPEIFAPLDADFGHFRRYTKPQLRRTLSDAGFVVHRLSYFNLAGYFAWWVNFCLLRKRGFDAGAVRFFDRVIFPPQHWLESRVLRPPIGQSLLAIAQAGGSPAR